MKKLKIMHIIPSLAKGGAERLVLDICNELEKRKDVEVKLVTFREDNDYEFLSKNIDWVVCDAKINLSVTGRHIFKIKDLNKLIKNFKPIYNIDQKDDKSPIYIQITKEMYPRVLISRKKDIHKNSYYLGPFTSSYSVRKVLKNIRKVFPFSSHKLGKRKCLYNQIDLCTPCPNSIESLEKSTEKEYLTKKYKSNIRYLKKVLNGKHKSVRNDLVRSMNRCSKHNPAMLWLVRGPHRQLWRSSPQLRRRRQSRLPHAGT